MEGRKLRVLLATEGTYPYHYGGVSIWCDILTKGMPRVDFVLYSIMMNPFVSQKFSLSSNVSLYKVPLWGTEEACEHIEKPFSEVILEKQKTTDTVIETTFLPLFHKLLVEIMSREKDPVQFGRLLVNLYDYFSIYEYKKTFKSELVWSMHKRIVWEFANRRENRLVAPNIYALTQSLGWLYRFLTIVNTPLPKVDITHSAAAAFCGIPCVLSKLKSGTPFLLTEHGVYLREQYLSLTHRKYPSFLNTFLIRFINSITQLNYYYADQVSPVCSYNTRWEKRFGVKPKNIEVIYNGVNKDLFKPQSRPSHDRVTIVTAARIDPIKDIETLLRAAAIVLATNPDIQFFLYGSVSVPAYYERCLELHQKLSLGERFVFAGHSGNMPAVYNSGDIIVLSSVSEAFPYSVIEAMLCAKPVVATDVGGIKEAIGDTGRTVAPRQPDELAEAIIHLASDMDLCRKLGREARERALSFFTLERVLSLHYKSYLKLTLAPIGSSQRIKRKNHFHQMCLEFAKGEVLEQLGYNKEAMQQFHKLLWQMTEKPAVAYLCGRMSILYQKCGDFANAALLKEKAQLIMELGLDTDQKSKVN